MSEEPRLYDGGLGRVIEDQFQKRLSEAEARGYRRGVEDAAAKGDQVSEAFVKGYQKEGRHTDASVAASNNWHFIKTAILALLEQEHGKQK